MTDQSTERTTNESDCYKQPTLGAILIPLTFKSYNKPVWQQFSSSSDVDSAVLSFSHHIGHFSIPRQPLLSNICWTASFSSRLSLQSPAPLPKLRLTWVRMCEFQPSPFLSWQRRQDDHKHEGDISNYWHICCLYACVFIQFVNFSCVRVFEINICIVLVIPTCHWAYGFLLLILCLRSGIPFTGDTDREQQCQRWYQHSSCL